MAILNDTVINGSLNVNGTLFVEGVTETIIDKDNNTTITQRASVNKIVSDLSEKMRQIWDIPGYYVTTSSKGYFSCYRIGPFVNIVIANIIAIKDYIVDTIPYGFRPFGDIYTAVNGLNSGYVNNYGRLDIHYNTGDTRITWYNYGGTTSEVYASLWYMSGDKDPDKTLYRTWDYKNKTK